MAILDWSHLFGSHNDPLHYRNMAIQPNDFKREMLAVLGIDDRSWQEYWNEVKVYRDKGVAHIEPVPTLQIPDLDLAYKSTAFYFHHFIPELKKYPKFKVYPDNIDKYTDTRFKKYSDHIDAICNSLLTS